MKAESTIKPASPFEIEINGDISTIKLYTNIQEVKEVSEEAEAATTKYVYEEYLLEVPSRSNLEANVQENYDEWLQLAIKKENEPKPETDKEKLLRMERENKQLGIELSEREINEITQGLQISDLEIQILELQMGGK